TTNTVENFANRFTTLVPMDAGGIMNQYFGGEPMAVEDVIALFQSITLTDLHDRLLWARVFLRTEHPSKPFLTALVNDLYQLGYRVYAGEFEITVDLGKTRIHERV